MSAEQLFVESALRFLRPSGYLVIVLPKGILNNPGNRFIRSWLLARSQLVAVVDLPTTTFAASKGINNPSVVIVRKFTRQEVEQADRGALPSNYEIFMAHPTTAGINKRAKPIYLRHPDGREKMDQDGRRVKDDQIATVADEFRRWMDKAKRPKRFLDS